jgi:hypothetical protein
MNELDNAIYAAKARSDASQPGPSRMPCEAAVRLSRIHYKGMGEWIEPDGTCLDEEQVNDLRAEVASQYMEDFGMFAKSEDHE